MIDDREIELRIKCLEFAVATSRGYAVNFAKNQSDSKNIEVAK